MVLHVESHEDYWEDASVSFGCNHEWGIASPFQMQEEADGCKMAVNAPKALQSNDSQQNSYASVLIAEPDTAKRLHNFPPPLTFCVTLSIKEGGRFVLKETDARPPLRSCFRAERTNGRLCLHLVEPEQLDEDSCDESTLLEAQYSDGGVLYSYMAAHEDDTAPHDCVYKHRKDDIVGDVESMSGSDSHDTHVKMEGEGLLKSAIDDLTDDAHDANDLESKRGNKVCAVNAASSLNTDAHLDCIDYSTSVNYEEKQEDLGSGSKEEASRDSMGTASDVLLAMERGPLWSANDMAPHIQAWSPNELLMRGSFANVSASLGLIVS